MTWRAMSASPHQRVPPITLRLQRHASIRPGHRIRHANQRHALHVRPGVKRTTLVKRVKRLTCVENVYDKVHQTT